MKLNLSEIIEVPGASIPFQCELDKDKFEFPSIKEFKTPIAAHGIVKNSAGVLYLTGKLQTEMLCVCDRCGAEFTSKKVIDMEVLLADAPEDEEDLDTFPLEGDWLDLSQLLETFFILDMDMKFLCKVDCAGLCERCGADLNNGPCGCRAEIDPRLAVLEQLLDK
ncbi:MAG TPA: DUF177 domain-containing protein [Clostridiales bacterium]|nr:DUF177 domain-containing protein [Clostridiales bacterium]